MNLAEDLASGLNGSSMNRPPQSRKEKLQAELKVLEWHKMANNAAIKAALIQTTTAAKSPEKVKTNHREDDAKWIKQVIQQEHIKPLEVNKQYVLEYEAREKENALRLQNQVARHINTLKTLRQKLEDRQDIKKRSNEYRAWQRDFVPKKNAVRLGKTIGELEAEPQREEVDEDADINDELMRAASNRKENQKYLSKKSQNQELSSVLDSLNRLQELEHRISSLEKDNKNDEHRQRERPSANQRNPFEFQKNRSVVNDRGAVKKAPVGVVYNVKLPAKSGVAAVRGLKGRSNSGIGHGNGIFITATGQDEPQTDDYNGRRQDRKRQLELASQGQKNMRSRMMAKKGRVKEQLVAAKKHEEAMRELQRRKNETASRKIAQERSNVFGRDNKRVTDKKRAVIPAKGIGAGIRTKNRHLQEFENMRKANNRKREVKAKPRMPPINREKNNQVGGRFISQTAPAYSNKNHPYHKINTKKEGTTTRRTGNNLPTRYPTRNDENIQERGKITKKAPGTAPQIAVTGVGGLRALKANRQMR